MEKIIGKIIEVNHDYSIVLGGYNRNPIKSTETAKKYISKEDVGKEAEVTIEGDKIIFIKILSSNGEGKANGNKVIEQINWNMGSISQTLKLQLLSELETIEKSGVGRSEVQKKIHAFLSKECDKYLKILEKIREEQEKNG